MRKEKLKINFLGFNIETENPGTKTVVIVAMVLLFLVVIVSLK
jgi:hypothetical protein